VKKVSEESTLPVMEKKNKKLPVNFVFTLVKLFFHGYSGWVFIALGLPVTTKRGVFFL
jgi:hypothetical protein